MKKALIITYYWPPSGGAGVQRWLKFVKYLRLFGWEPVVYTPRNPEYPETDQTLLSDVPPGITILRTPILEPYSAYKRFIGRNKDEKISAGFLTEKKKNSVLENISVWIRGNLFIPDARRFWINPSVRFLVKQLQDDPVDIIISTGPPHSMHLIGMNVSRKLNIPWIADFRDPWTNIDFYRDLKLTRRADIKHRRLEKMVLKEATAVITISRSMAEDFNRIHHRDYEVITNGYDPEDVTEPGEIVRDEKFSIAHIGTMVSTRNPFVFWKAVRSILNDNPQFGDDLVIRLIGKVDFKVLESIEEYGLTPYVELVNYLPHPEVVKIQQCSRVLLLIINDTPNSKMILTGKFFEYLAARRPILCIGPVDGDAAGILAETGAGLISGFSDEESMKVHILQYYNSYKKGELQPANRNIDMYSRKELTGKLATLLDKYKS